MTGLSIVERMIFGLILVLFATSTAAPLDDSDVSDELSDVTRRKRNDDVGISALQDIVSQQAATITSMQSQMTALQNEIAAVKASLPAAFASVAFTVRFSHDHLATSSNSILKFDNIITNLGNGYDSQTGIFTAPHAGLYSFYIRFMSENIGHTYVDIVKHGAMLDRAFANGGTDYDQGSTEVTVHMAKGEQVWAKVYSGASIRGYTFTTFTGFLVQAD